MGRGAALRGNGALTDDRYHDRDAADTTIGRDKRVTSPSGAHC